MVKRSIDFEYPIVEGYVGRQGVGTQNVDWEERINMDRMRKYRVNRVKEQMKKHDIGAVIAINEWNMRYCTSTWTPYWTTPSSGLRYAMLPVHYDFPILYEQGEIGYHTRQIAPWLPKVKVAITGAGWIGATMGPHQYLVQRKKFVEQIVNDLKEAGVAKEKIAIDTPDPGLLEEFKNAGINITIEGMGIFLQARKIKSKDEIECLRVGCSIGDAQFGAVARAIKPGVKESELCGIAHKTAYDLGGRVYSGIFATSGPFGWPNSRDESDRMIRPGDVLYMDVYNTAYEGYKICYYRTFSCGKAPQKAKDDYKKTYDWLYKAINTIKPGVSTKEVAEQWPPGPAIWGDILVEFEDQTAGSNWAHGIGLTLYEPPVIWRETSLEDPVMLEEGMTFAIETQHGVPGSHGVRIEEVIVVTKDGVEVLSKFPVEEITEVPLF